MIVWHVDKLGKVVVSKGVFERLVGDDFAPSLEIIFYLKCGINLCMLRLSVNKWKHLSLLSGEIGSKRYFYSLIGD